MLILASRDIVNCFFLWLDDAVNDSVFCIHSNCNILQDEESYKTSDLSRSLNRGTTIANVFLESLDNSKLSQAYAQNSAAAGSFNGGGGYCSHFSSPIITAPLLAVFILVLSS